MAVPKYDDLFNPLLEAIHNLGGSGSTVRAADKGLSQQIAENISVFNSFSLSLILLPL